MKTIAKRVTIFLLIFSMIFTTIMTITPEKKVDAATYTGKIWKTSYVKLRKSKSSKSKVLRKIKKGKKVTVLSTSGRWRKVVYKGTTGYVKRKHVYIKTKASDISSDISTRSSEVAQYAKLFVGNPYVYGGTSLNSGADCSGFVMSVYRAFGYKLPRSSSSMRNAGKKVSYRSKRIGDLIVYYGHVAIYIGNNKIVHASSRKTGIKISSNPKYRKIHSVRRVIGI